MNREGKKCVLYPRVSTEMQVDGYSLEGQKNGLKRFADREEMEIVGIYEDAGKSGKSIEGRPAFKKMLSDIKNGLEIDYILVYKLSRFGRNAADILNSLEFVQSYGINLICIEEGIDSSQTSGKLLISVLSAVAEIERENIIEQTMNGRREKARQGGWNGGFAPYGYYLKDNQLLIEETEAEAIRIIFDKFANTDVGLGGVAKYLNLQGIKKIPRQNGTLETWSSHFIRLILDNPVYCGKIAYGRRTREKVKGTKNEYKQVHAEDYILEDGQHEGIISEELWQKVHAKRMATGIKQPSKIGKDRSHLLTGILKCPLCGSSMYTNKHAWTNKDGTYKEVYYYICGRNKQERGHHCDYKASLRKTDIEPLVIEAVKELVSDKYFAKEIEKRIGVQTDTTAIDKELANYESKLKEVDLNKARLEREIDNLPIDARFRERKIHDMTLRLDGLYDTIVELEERIEDAKLRKSSIEMETITLDNIYKLMLNFGKLYDIISDEEKKNLITYLIKEIQIYPNGESEQPLKSIEFNFPIYRDGQEVRRLLWEKGNTVETQALLGYLKADTEIRLTVDGTFVNPAEPIAAIINERQKIRGLKVDTAGQALTGAAFSLINADTGEIVDVAASDEKGEFYLTGFGYGDWIIRETVVPEGFNRVEDVLIHVDEDWKAPNTLLFTDIPNHYEFIKVDEDGCPMEGVKFALEDEDGNVLRELASGEDGIVHADDLKPGVYVIREIETQAGYRLTEETIRVVIDENYIVADELFRLVNFPEEERPRDEIQTGVDVPVTPMMRFGAASVICGMAIFVLQAIKKRRMRSID